MPVKSPKRDSPICPECFSGVWIPATTAATCIHGVWSRSQDEADRDSVDEQPSA